MTQHLAQRLSSWLKFIPSAFLALHCAGSYAEDAESTLDEVVIVGSRSGASTVLKSASPVEVIAGSELVETGARTLSEALQASVPSFRFPTSVPSSNAASFVKGVSLRGLATDQTLVLIDGKRRHATAQLNAGTGTAKGAQTVDLNSIPISAIERVEVLLDGASAQYGSDAIAGVINIVLKERSRGGDLSALFGRNSKGDGQTETVDGNVGTTLPGDGFLTVSFDAWDVRPTRLSTTDTRQMYFSGDPRESTYPNRNWFYGSGRSKRYNLVVNAESTIDWATVYGFATYGWREDNGFGNLRQPNADQTVRAIFPDGFQPFLNVKSRDAAVTGGLKFGTEAVGKFDLSATYGRNRVASVVSNTDNASLGIESPTEFNTGDLLNTQTSLNLEWTRPFELAALRNPLSVSSGLTFRHESYEVFQGDYGSWANGGVRILDGPNAGKVATPGSQGFGGFSPDDAGSLSRNVGGAYLDLETNLTDRFKVAAAGRTEHYSDFGSTTNGRLALRYQVVPALAWRGSASTGYRAPSLGQSAYSRTIPNITNGVLSTNRIAPVDSALARALGATDLTPEKSTNLSTGLVWVLGNRASFSADVYRIDIDDRIVLSDVLRGALVTKALTAAGFPTFSGLQFFTNAADTRTKGIELTGRYDVPLGAAGEVDFSAGYNRSDTEITSVKPAPSVLAGSGLVLIGHEARGVIEGASPGSSARIAADYTLNRFSAHLSAVRFGAYRALSSTSATLDQTFSPQTIANLQAAYRFSELFRVTAGVDNLFNSHPDQVIPAARNPVVSLYSGLSPEGGAGSFWYVRASLSFR